LILADFPEEGGLEPSMKASVRFGLAQEKWMRLLLIMGREMPEPRQRL
jgi:hypothetical protein